MLIGPANGMISCSLGGDGLPNPEETCTVTCDDGYELTGSDSRTCQNDGSWNGSDAMCSRSEYHFKYNLCVANTSYAMILIYTMKVW